MRRLTPRCSAIRKSPVVTIAMVLCALVQNVAMASTSSRSTVDTSATSVLVPLRLVTRNDLAQSDAVGAPSPAGCSVSIEDAHIARSVVNSVKVNAKLQCNYRVAELSLSVTLWKVHALGLGEVQASTPSHTRGDKLLENNGTFRECTNSKDTTWYGTATADSIEDGQQYEAMVRSLHNATLACGT